MSMLESLTSVLIAWAVCAVLHFVMVTHANFVTARLTGKLRERTAREMLVSWEVILSAVFLPLFVAITVPLAASLPKYSLFTDPSLRKERPSIIASFISVVVGFLSLMGYLLLPSALPWAIIVLSAGIVLVLSSYAADFISRYC